MKTTVKICAMVDRTGAVLKKAVPGRDMSEHFALALPWGDGRESEIPFRYKRNGVALIHKPSGRALVCATKRHTIGTWAKLAEKLESVGRGNGLWNQTFDGVRPKTGLSQDQLRALDRAGGIILDWRVEIDI